jgi:hypothetical protein
LQINNNNVALNILAPDAQAEVLRITLSIDGAPFSVTITKKKTGGGRKRDIFTPRFSPFFIPVANKQTKKKGGNRPTRASV